MKKSKTEGESELIRGKGAPLLTVEGHTIAIADFIWVVDPSASAYNPAMPFRAEVIGLDLTRRTVRLRNNVGREVVHCATNEGHNFFWLFVEEQLAVQNSIAMFEKNVKHAERRADNAIEELAKAKSKLAKAKAWKSDGGMERERKECPT